MCVTKNGSTLNKSSRYTNSMHSMEKALTPGACRGLKKPLMATAMEYIEQNIHHPISLDSLSARCSMSKFHFARLFKKSTGYAPLQYIVDVRILRAKKILKESDIAIEKIAASVGYNNASYFSRFFKKHTGYSPKAYRAKFRINT